MQYKPVPAFKAEDGTLFEHEADAIRHSLTKITGFNDASAQNVMDNASAIIAHLQKFLSIQPPKS